MNSYYNTQYTKWTHSKVTISKQTLSFIVYAILGMFVINCEFSKLVFQLIAVMDRAECRNTQEINYGQNNTNVHI